MTRRTLQPLAVPTRPDLARLLPRLSRALAGDGPALLLHPGDRRPEPRFGPGRPLAPDEDDPHDPTALLVATSGSSGPNVVASGVAEALWATAAGLVVAIPSVVSYNVFKNKAKNIMTDLEIASRELVLMFKSDKKQASK